MIKKIIAGSLLVIALVLALSACTIEDPGHVIIDEQPLEVSLEPDSEVTLVDSDGNALTVDESTVAISTIGYEHHKIHSGSSFYANVHNDDLDVGQTLDLTIETADIAEWMHIVWSAEAIGALHILVYEGVTVNVPGVAVTPLNRDRNSAHTSAGTFRDGDTFSAFGTLIWEWHTGSKKEGGFAGERAEVILKQGTTYLYRVESQLINNKVAAIVSWYEHTKH